MVWLTFLAIRAEIDEKIENHF